MKNLVYVASPYSGDIEGNTIKAREYSRYVVDNGGVPIAPHLLFPQFVSESSERELALEMNLKFLDTSDEVWVFGETISNGMKFEIEYAKKKGIPIKYFPVLTDLFEYSEEEQAEFFLFLQMDSSTNFADGMYSKKVKATYWKKDDSRIREFEEVVSADSHMAMETIALERALARLETPCEIMVWHNCFSLKELNYGLSLGVDRVIKELKNLAKDTEKEYNIEEALLACQRLEDFFKVHKTEITYSKVKFDD